MRILHLVSHTHWDREWYLTYQQFRIKLVQLVDNLLDILKSTPEYQHFTLDGQTIVLEDYLAVRPECEVDLQRFIQNGRILIGPWYVLPDEFLVSPEAIIRNLLEGDRICRRFGAKMMVGYVPDPFGHIGQLPQILRGFGIETASVMRGLADEPCELWWESPDGSRVLMGYLRTGYGNAAGVLNSHFDTFVSEVDRVSEELVPHAAAPHLLLMHGVDHMEPQAHTPAAITYAAGRINGNTLVHSTLPDYFKAIGLHLSIGQLPVVQGELRACKRSPLLPAVLSTRMWIKQRNRASENLLEKWAEPFSTWAGLVPTDYRPSHVLRRPATVLREAWRLLMQCHPHDSICGCSIDQVHDEMRPRFDQVDQMAEEITRQGLVVLASATATTPIPAAIGDQQAICSAVVVFNPTGSLRTDTVTARLDEIPEDRSFELLDETGQVIPYQTLGMGSSEFMNTNMTAKELRDGLKMISDGIVMGLRIQKMDVHREGSQGYVNLILSEKGEPNLPAWEHGRQAINALLADAGLDLYSIKARSTSASQVIFTAANVPAHGYRAFWVRSKPLEVNPPARLSRSAQMLMPVVTRLAGVPAVQRLAAQVAPDPNSRPPYRIENEYYLVEVQSDGTFDLLEKATGKRFSGLNRFVDGGDRGDEYNYSPPPSDQIVTARLKSARKEIGPVRQTLEVTLELEIPRSLAPNRKTRSAVKVVLPLVSRITIYAGVARVDVQTHIDNTAHDHRLRVHFPTPFVVNEADYDGHFEVIRRPLDLPASDSTWVEQPRPEVPQRAFTTVFDGAAGLLVANRGLPEVEVLRQANGSAEIAITLLRCVGWLSRDDFPERKGHAGPGSETPGAQLPGRWSFDYAIIPYQASGRMAAIEQAYAFETPLRAECTGLHDGLFSSTGAFLQVEPPEFIISTVKAAEDGNGWVVRGYNISKQPISLALRTMLPYQQAARANLGEEILSTLQPDSQGWLRLEVKPCEVVTLRFL